MRTRSIAKAVMFTALFAGLVLVLLWFQGIIGRPEHGVVEVPEPPRVGAGDRIVVVEEVVLPTAEPYPGFVEAVDPVTLASRVAALVVEVAKREGESFDGGETLVELDDRDARARIAAAEAALASAEAEASRARLEFERVVRLHASEAATERDLEAAHAANAAGAAHVERAARELDAARAALAYYLLDAPFAGRVLARHIDPGSLASPGQTLLELYRADALRLRFAVPEDRARELAAGSALTVELAGDRESAKLTRILPSSDPATGTVTLHLVLPEALPDARPGTFARLELPTGERRVALVPDAAVRRIGQVESVLAVVDERVVPRTVRTGKRHGEAVEVLSGLSAGERVVIR